jgi:hypothetical protein
MLVAAAHPSFAQASREYLTICSGDPAPAPTTSLTRHDVATPGIAWLAN